MPYIRSVAGNLTALKSALVKLECSQNQMAPVNLHSKFLFVKCPSTELNITVHGSKFPMYCYCVHYLYMIYLGK